MCGESQENELDSIIFRNYDKRLASFNHKWRGRIKPETLARCGFYYLAVDDLCKCFYCGAEIYRWDYNDCPIEEHYRLCKNCDLNICLKRSKTVRENISENSKSIQENNSGNNISFIVFLVLLNIIISIYNLY